MAKVHVTTSINGEPMEFLCEPQTPCSTRCAGRSASPAPRKAARPAIAAPAAITLDDRLVCSCLMLAVEAEGHEIRTIEGMASGEKLHPLQQKFLEMAALQCGICTSGMLVASDALLAEESEAERGGSPLLARRQSLPVHRLRQDRPRSDGNRDRNAGQEKRSRPMNIVTNNKWIGQRTIRPDGVDKVTGRAAFAADTNMPGMIWGKILRSPHPHARIKSIDTSKAEKLPGVKAVVTARDIVDFPVDKIRHARHPGHALDVPQRDGAREGAVPRPSRRGGRRHLGSDRGKSLRADRGRLRSAAVRDRDRRCAEARRADPARVQQVRGQALEHRRQARSQEGRHRRRLQGGRGRRSSAPSPRARCTRAISSRTPASSASPPTTRPRSGARARASSWSAP